MTHLCVPIFVTSVAQAKADIAGAAEAGADLVELRIDQFTDEFQLRQLLGEAMLPCILTCRPEWEGGHSTLNNAERFKILSIRVGDQPRYIDVELAAVDEFEFEDKGGARPKLIVSSHDFSGRPERLYNIVSDLDDSRADINKIVWTARTVRDNLEAFELISSRRKPTIALCMSEAGIISRILAKKFGAFLTFASLRQEKQTAPGQVPIDDLKRLYRWDAINAQTKVFGVVGSPVAHSMSPAIHNAAFDETGFNGVYVPLLVNDSYESFKAFMEDFLAVEHMDLAGLSITIPHKENALRYLTSDSANVEPMAKKIGAVNTIVIGRVGPYATLRGINTDYAAILDSITAAMGIKREQLADYRVAVIGAGGTGRTAVAALAHYGATVVVYNRTRDRAEALAAEFNGKSGKVVAAPMEKLCDSCCQIYIQTTSVGMHPKVDVSVFGDKPPKLSDKTVVFDTVYNPLQTKLLQQAQAAGAKTISGLEMFVRQAAAQFRAWTNIEPPLATMRRVVEARLKP